MAEVTFGVQFNGTAMGASVDPLRFAARAEGWGFGSIFVPDLEASPSLDPMILLSGVAQHTQRMLLGTSVLGMPFRRPFRLAKQALSVNAISGNRLVLGVGAGMFAKDFAADEVDKRQRGKMTDEALEVVRSLFDGGEVTHRGQFYDLDGVELVQPAVKPEAPPIWIGAGWNDGFSESGLARTARFGDGFYPFETPVEGYKAAQETIRKRASSLGRDPEAITWAYMFWLGMGPSVEVARSDAQEGLIRRFGDDAWEVTDAGYLLGSAEQCAEQLAAFIDMGVSHVIVNALGEPSKAVEDYERFAREVVSDFAG